MAQVGVTAARAAGRPMLVPRLGAAAAVRASEAGTAMYQSAVCAELNVWPSMPMHAQRHNQELVVVGTWYWCDGVWIGYYQRGPGEGPTDWLA